MNKNTITFKKEHLESFYNFSRDKNPLHLDSQYAALIIPVSKSISDQTNINNLHNYLSSSVEIELGISLFDYFFISLLEIFW